MRTTTPAPSTDTLFSAALTVLAVVVAGGCWWVYQFAQMAWTPCGGTDSCRPAAQPVIAVGFLVALTLAVVLPIALGVRRRATGRRGWWCPVLSAVGAVLVLVAWVPLTLWAAG